MILEQLTLNNFCLYRGQQIFDLTPRKRNGNSQPIVLFGGINGGGKTTLLDAIQLALYGPRAKCSKRVNLSYEDFLRECIHRGRFSGNNSSETTTTSVNETEVALSFRYAADGEEHIYEVHRAWQVREGKLRETLDITRDGMADRWLSDNWHQLVEELIPLGISQLFFFDAEKIRFLAEDETANNALGGAIKSLLGLDLAERLIADATVLEGRISKSLLANDDRLQLDDLEQQIGVQESELRLLRTERAALQNDLLRTENNKCKAEERFASVGGKHWDDREALRCELQSLATRETEIRTQLITLAAGELPFALVSDLRRRVLDQDQRERTAAESAVLCRVLSDRDRRILTALEEQRVSAKVIRLIRDVQDADRQSLDSIDAVLPRLQLSEVAHSLARHVEDSLLVERQTEADGLIAELQQVQHDRESIDRSLAAAPDEEGIKDVAERLQTATKEFALAEDAARRLDLRIDAASRAVNELQERRQKVVSKRVNNEIEHEEGGRMATLAARTRMAMNEFLRRATAAKIDRLSSLITESFRFLVRKQTLVQQIMIDPKSFAITLFGSEGEALPKQRLSEGEKQIFAISVLWGLARASARSLPAIIDTPMARLDAKHREHLVERYFPNASHQVIVLSTDTEVDRHYYEALEPHIARAYHLNYSDDEKRTIAEEGYFWESATTAGCES